MSEDGRQEKFFKLSKPSEKRVKVKKAAWFAREASGSSKICVHQRFSNFVKQFIFTACTLYGLLGGAGGSVRLSLLVGVH
jgi:hypothetical protein